MSEINQDDSSNLTPHFAYKSREYSFFYDVSQDEDLSLTKQQAILAPNTLLNSSMVQHDFDQIHGLIKSLSDRGSYVSDAFSFFMTPSANFIQTTIRNNDLTEVRFQERISKVYSFPRTAKAAKTILSFPKTQSLNSKYAGKYTCCHPNCQELLTTPLNLSKHLLTHWTQKLHLCPICSKSFPGIPELELHLQDHEMKAKKRSLKSWSCPLCFLKTDDKTRLRKHFISHDNW